MTFRSTKTYGAEQGLSCAFRQWRANDSHCHLIHGYALGFRFTFECSELNERGWVMDFGGLKPLKERLQLRFDHVLAIATDDPAFSQLTELAFAGIAKIQVFQHGVGIERFAKYAADIATAVLFERGEDSRVWVHSVECFEHAGNSAIYIAE